MDSVTSHFESSLNSCWLRFCHSKYPYNNHAKAFDQVSDPTSSWPGHQSVMTFPVRRYTWHFFPHEAQSLFRLLQYTDWEHLGDGYLNQKKVAEVVGDYFFICPTNLFAEYFASRGTRVYYYFFTQVRLVSQLQVLTARISENAGTCL